MVRHLIAVTLLHNVLRAAADIPVHCLRHEIAGDWRFVLGKPSATRSACGHKRPDVEEMQPSREIVDVSGHAEEITVKLAHPNTATIQGQKGAWTMVYDEGFEVAVGKRVFFAFSNFTFDQDAMHQKHNVSHCDSTMVGWYSSTDRKEFGCYYGIQRKRDTQAAAPTAKKHSTALAKDSTYDKPLDNKSQIKKVAKLNKKLAMLQLGWTARVMPQYEGKTLREINSYAGIKRKMPSRDLHKDMISQRKIEPVRRPSFLQQQERGRRARADPVPDSFSWNDVNGNDYTEPVMDQGDCGSCYDASTMRMLTARYKIKLNDTSAIPWSINFPLFCSEFNQGCKGGYGFLTTKWSQDVGLIPATCMRYNTQGSCKLECDLEKELKGKTRYRAANHRYINSWYGNFDSSVEAIKAELYHNGPIVLSFEPGEDFMFYSEGIYKSANTTLSKLKKHVDYDQEWERVDHAVVAIGYGEENGQKYWLIQNSWGQDWGEDGFFRMARGEDESGIESIPEAADVVEDEEQGRQVEALFAEKATLATA